jgi:transcriptional regulator with XRE-family HTH domain
MGLDELLEQVRSVRQLPPATERRRIREAAGVTQRALGRALGVGWTTIDRWESGSTPRDPERRAEYAHALEELRRLAA